MELLETNKKKDYNDVSTYPLPLNKEILNNDLEQFMFRSCMEEFHKRKYGLNDWWEKN